MEQLGKLEELPERYREELNTSNLVPLWPNLRSFIPPHKPRPQTVATAWYFQQIKPLLLEAGELTPIEKAERRVLALANPGHGLENMKASPAMYLGMQLLLPQEWAPAHRHAPNAVRLIVEGEGAYTTVEGQKCMMEHGDLILTPSGLWHEHGHDGDQPVIWMDILDLPLVYYMEASFVEEGRRQEIDRINQGSTPQYAAGVVPTPHFSREDASYPMMRYAWEDTKKVLDALAEKDGYQEPLHVAYVNPETGKDCQNILGYSALLLRPNEVLSLPLRSTAQVFHVIEGGLTIEIDQQDFHLTKADTACAPCFATIDLINTYGQPCYVFIADEAPLQRKLGLYSVRERHVAGVSL
ncbi:cupin domain-containing protein [Acinetobacter haemolyticus]|uniref:cupin domain-containing protein n=1 Tax=Acinetobacter haemolyticus TaxID=29430 RepID=UPI0012987A61|nr:cupin domain-containing protein [Acinetobacter haemolyticus]MQZ30327.1 cupin domain-containing protein [Acinetobacter haemolyticus]